MTTPSCPHITVVVISPTDGAALCQVMPDLVTLQGLVGGNIQSLMLPHHGLLYLNEDGKYQGHPPNQHATLLARHLDLGLAPDDIMVGSVVLLGATTRTGVNDGEEHDVPDKIVEACRVLGIPVTDETTAHSCR